MDENTIISKSELFLKYDYPETKDMCKQFLTLASAILVVSLTFSEKIIDFSTASTTTKWLIITAWSFLLLSIISCGIGLLLITVAGGDAVYAKVNYLSIAYQSYKAIIVAGISFVTGLLLLIGAAISSMYK